MGKTELPLQERVEHPDHYNFGTVECLDAIRASLSKEAYAGFLKGNIMKYLWRYEHKGGLEDLKKASFYLERLKEEY